MVLLNGIKYACERCIRGHRVSSCTHTDKPLVMIKPKGRPASQCTHCREQSKVKNAHASCNCGKKGKSPGMHLASCSCHKNSHCTCVSKDRKGSALESRRKSPEAGLSDSGDASQSEFSQSHSDFTRMTPQPSSVVSAATYASDSDFLIEDIALPFETGQGLLDYFSSSNPYLAEDQSQRIQPNQNIQQNQHMQPKQDPNSQFQASGMSQAQSSDSVQISPRQMPSGQGHNENLFFNSDGSEGGQHSGQGYFPNPPSDADLDLVENMYPLFPLVGFNSFDNDKSLPLSGMPEPSQSNETWNGPQPQDHSSAGTFPKSNSPARSESRHDPRRLSVTGLAASSRPSHPSNNASSASLSNGNPQATHHPRPLKASTSFSVGAQSRPRRPDSSMSVASTSSNTSKQNLFEPASGQHSFPKTPSSAAFPPFSLSNNNSVDDFQHGFNSSGFFNENRSLPILSDEEGSKVGLHSGNVTPRSSISRQLSQTRRKASLTRSHSQLHHNMVTKEHSFHPVKAGPSSDNSPRQVGEKKFGHDSLVGNLNEVDTYLGEVTEESPASLPPPVQASGYRQSSLHSVNDDFNLENPEFSLIPMYKELFEPMYNGM